MESLFRFMLFRPPIEPDEHTPGIELSQKSALQVALLDAQNAEDPRMGARRAATTFMGTNDFIGSPDEGDLARASLTLQRALAEIARSDTISRTKVLEAVKSAFGKKASDLVEEREFTDRIARLRDSILAIKYEQTAHRLPVAGLVAQLRALSLVSLAVAMPDFPETPTRFRQVLQRTIQLPKGAGWQSGISSQALDDDRKKHAREAREARNKQIAELVEEYRLLAAADAELSQLDAASLTSTPVDLHPGVAISEDVRPESLYKGQVSYSRQLSSLFLERMGSGSDRPPFLTSISASSQVQPVAELVTAAIASTPRGISGSPRYVPPDLSSTGFHLSAPAARSLSEGTRKALAKLNLDTARTPLDRIVEAVRERYGALALDLEALVGDNEKRTIRSLGNAIVSVVTPAVNVLTDVLAGTPGSPIPEFIPAIPGVPTSHRRIEPSGIADLLIVKQQLTGYEAVDIAHIENILKGEEKSRTHVRREETEQLTFLETELTTTEERELQTTDRFELSRETSRTIASDNALKAGLSVSGKYGPTVEFSATAEGSTSRSREETTRAASEFSQDVTERSARTVSERILQRTSLRVTKEITDTNTHGFNNAGGPDHVVGIYQWINKVYEAQVYNYGLRLMFDFMVAEPAAMIANVLTAAHAKATELRKPPEFTLKPNEVRELTYGFWVRAYGATDVEPPPDVYTTVSHDFSGGNGDDNTNYNHSTQLTIPDGYRAVQGSVAAGVNVWDADKFSIDLALGRRTKRMSNGDTHWVTTLSDERGSIPFAMNTLQVSDIAVAIEVKCQRTTAAIQKWQADTHAKLTTAYRARLSEYEEKLAAIEFDSGAQIEGLNPALNLRIMRDELKKHCISLITDQHFELFDAVDAGGLGLPQLDLEETIAEGAYVRFFEQAFEWENLTWVTYPYFWGRRSGWRDKVVFEDIDPAFSDFVKAGYARVSVPVRPGFESAIEHFMTFGELWNGGPLPMISDPLYLPIADELAERLDRPGAEVPQGEPWTVRIPTTLVRLRSQASLPRWTQDETGNWVPAEG